MKHFAWIEVADAIALHARLLNAHGGATGIRDHALLAAALARPRNHSAYTHAGVVELASLYTVGIVRNHPFVDGNKRTGFVVGVLFLELNGYAFSASEEAAAQAVIAIAAGDLDEGGYAGFVGENSSKRSTRSQSPWPRDVKGKR